VVERYLSSKIKHSGKTTRQRKATFSIADTEHFLSLVAYAFVVLSLRLDRSEFAFAVSFTQ